MPTPEGLNTTLLHGLYVEPDATGTPLQGTLSFTPNPSFIMFPTQNAIVAGTETATLDANGEFTIELVSTDNTGSNPGPGAWLYTVTEKIIGQRQRTYNIALPHNGGVTLELADITPTDDAPSYIPVVGPQGAPGVITTVNGKSASSITLVAADLPDLIPLAQKAAANGVATLDGTTKIPVAQIPSLSGTYVPWSNVEVANGVASLDASAKVKSTELNLAAATPTAIANTGAVGTATNLAREDHTHAGVALTGTQSASGAKNFTTSLQTAQFGVGIAPGSSGARAYVNSTVDETGLLVAQTTMSATNPLISCVGFDTNITAFSARVNADTVARVAIKASGNIEFGPGNGARDVTFYRSNTNTVNITGQLWMDTAAPTAAGHVTRKDYVDGLDGANVKLTGGQTISGVKTFTASPIFQASVGTIVTKYQVAGDTTPRQTVTSDGIIAWGPGNAATDITLYRDEAGTIGVSGIVRSYRATAGNNSFSTRVTGDTVSRWFMNADGGMFWGPGGSTATDTNLYRSAVGTLKTDNIFIAQVQTTTSGTVASNFTLTSFNGRKTAGITSIFVALTYTGSTLTADSAGNLADTLCFTLPAGYIPPIAMVEAFDKSGVATGDVYIDTDGTCKLKTLSPTATLANTGTVTFNATWVA